MPLEWTDEARGEFERRYAAAVDASPTLSPEERAATREKFAAAVEARGRSPVTAHDVHAAIDRVEEPPPAFRGEGGWSWLGSGLLATSIVVMPSIALLVELTTHMCASEFFDPIPTLAHVVLIAWVPIAGALALRRSRLSRSQLEDSTRGFAIGASVGIALPVTLLYLIAFLPLVPFSLFAILMGGIGLLGLTPVACGIAFPILVRQLARRTRDRRFFAGLGLGCAATIAFLAATEWRTLATDRWIESAVHGTPAERESAIAALRRFGDDEALARRASGSPAVIGPLSPWTRSGSDRAFGGANTTVQSARKVWFAVHGTRFHGPLRQRTGFLFDTDFGAFDADADFGSESVGVAQRELFLATSRIDGAFDAPAGLAYIEWTIELSNASRFRPLEARLLVELPDEAVISRATLWVAGEEREAAFAPTASARMAYEAVAVTQRRDPLLVTHQGDDRVLVQCFPVPERGSMKLRLGVTVPLDARTSSCELRLPRIASRNFELAPELEHAVGVEARHALTADGLAARTDPDGRSWVEGRLRAAALEPEAAAAWIRASERPAPRVASRAEDGELVCTFEQRAPRAGLAPVFVVDTSVSLAPFLDELRDALRRTFASEELVVVVAHDGEPERREIAPGADPLVDVDCVGGRDNLLALANGFDAARERGSDLVWITGPQPETFPGAELDRRLSTKEGLPRLVCVQLVAGDNVVVARDPGRALWECIDASHGVERALAIALGRDDRLERTWSVAPAAPDGAHRGPDHLVDLHAASEIERLARGGRDDVARAVEIARANHLVTAVSGAVVLETDEQLKTHGLEAADAEELPSVPEPETVLLVLVAAAVAMLVHRRSRRERLA